MSWLKKKTRIELIEDYVNLAQNKGLEISISTNYGNETIIQIHSQNTTKTRAKRVSENNEKEKSD